MNQPLAPPAQTGPPDAALEYRALLQFVHLAPVGLVQARHSGLITMMNPMATQLLAHLGFGDGDAELNLFDLLDKATPDVRTLAQTFRRSSGVVCDNFRVPLPEQPGQPQAPIALGLTMMQLQADPDGLMVVITDASAEVRLQRLRASWMR